MCNLKAFINDFVNKGLKKLNCLTLKLCIVFRKLKAKLKIKQKQRRSIFLAIETNKC